MSVERTGRRTGLPYKVRWNHAGVHHARGVATAAACEKVRPEGQGPEGGR
jgi:hypothetical protein